MVVLLRLLEVAVFVVVVLEVKVEVVEVVVKVEVVVVRLMVKVGVVVVVAMVEVVEAVRFLEMVVRLLEVVVMVMDADGRVVMKMGEVEVMRLVEVEIMEVGVVVEVGLVGWWWMRVGVVEERARSSETAAPLYLITRSASGRSFTI